MSRSDRLESLTEGSNGSIWDMLLYIAVAGIWFSFGRSFGRSGLVWQEWFDSRLEGEKKGGRFSPRTR